MVTRSVKNPKRGAVSARIRTKADHTLPGTRDFESERSWLGFQVKRERHLRNMRLAHLADAAGISPSLISKIEHNKLDPSLSTLHRIAKALGISISALFAMEELVGKVVMTKAERRVAGVDNNDVGEGIVAEMLVPYEAGRQLEGLLFTLEPGGHSGGDLQHEGEEVGYVIEGQLELVVNSVTYIAGPGDSFYFNSSLVHSYRNPGKTPAQVIWVNTPPTF